MSRRAQLHRWPAVMYADWTIRYAAAVEIVDFVNDQRIISAHFQREDFSGLIEAKLGEGQCRRRCCP